MTEIKEKIDVKEALGLPEDSADWYEHYLWKNNKIKECLAILDGIKTDLDEITVKEEDMGELDALTKEIVSRKIVPLDLDIVIKELDSMSGCLKKMSLPWYKRIFA